VKKAVIFLLMLGLVGIFSIGAQAKELKIGCVDAIEVFNEYTKTKDYDKILESKKQDKEKKLETKGAELEKLQNKINVLKKEEQAKEKGNLEKLQREFLELKRQAFIDLKKDRDEKMQEIIEDINKVIKDYSVKNAYDLMLYKSAIIYNDNSFDITAEILKLVNEKYNKKK
jgi:Skp family chaperone for outer membrane proteins